MMQLKLQVAPLRLGLAYIGDVPEDHEKMRGLTVLADEQPLAPLKDSYGTVQPDDAVIRHFLRAAPQDGIAIDHNGRAIVGVHTLHQVLEARRDRPGLEPKNTIKLVRPLDRVGLQIAQEASNL